MPISRFLDPKNDFAFKQIFGTEKNKDILIHFLNDILGNKGEDQIVEVTFLKPNQDPDIAVYKQSIVDVLCTDENGTQIIVEMQVGKHKGFEKRAQLYAAKAYSSQIIKEDENHKNSAVYAKLKGVIFLAISDFIIFPNKPEWKSEHRLLDTKTYSHDLKDFYFIFMELKKFHKDINHLDNLIEKWAYFFKYAHQSTLVEMEHLIGKDLVIKRAFQAIDQASWTEEELRTYEHIIKVRLDNLAVEQQRLEDAEEKGKAIGEAKGIAIGEAKGIAIGEAKGIAIGEAKGIAIGEAKGIAESKIEIAKNLIAKGFDEKTISELTGLTEKEIKKL